MKQLLLSVLILGCSITIFAQTTKKPATKPASTSSSKPSSNPSSKSSSASSAVAMKSSLDSFSYALGLSIASFYKEQGVKNINNSLVMKALNDSKAGKPLLNEAQINQCIVGYMQLVSSEKAAGNKKEGDAFLAVNKTKEGVIALPSGLQYQVMKEGTGPKPTMNDRVKVHYHGTLIDGTIFESSVQRGEPIEFGVGGVITGWTEALLLMPVGSKWRLFIPSSLAYGDNQMGKDIKPGSTLIFEVELLDIVK
jgi:FKBP-type peptidyl-prolyl cis-trans isomerase FklB